MFKHIIRILQFVVCVSMSFLPLAGMADDAATFYVLNSQKGLSSDNVWQITQLRDGRMVVMTDRSVDVYNGRRFNSIQIDTALYMPLPDYTGETRLFTDADDHLWMKRKKRLYCFDLRTMKQHKEDGWTASDVFIDSYACKWLSDGKRLHGNPACKPLPLPRETCRLQDIADVGDTIYAFFETGMLVAYRKDGSILFRSKAYGQEQASQYLLTSLVVKGFDGCIYPVRSGHHGSILLAFDTHSRRWRTLLTSDKMMHTLTATPTGWLYVTTPDGYLRLNPVTGQQETFRELHLPDGSVLSTGINTVLLDREGGIWLGTYQNGLLYSSPLSGLFATRPIDISVFPILTDIYLHSQPLEVFQDYDGKQILTVTPPYVSHLDFDYDQNSLAFQFSTMNYVRPRSTCYRYRFSGDGNQWHTVSADSVPRLVDDNGVFYLPLVGLSPGHYTLEVMATTNPGHWDKRNVRRITFTIRPPWWQSPVAFAFYILGAGMLVFFCFRLYRRRLERQNREALLMEQVRRLAEQVNQYEHAEAMVVLSEPKPTPDPSDEKEPPAPEPTEQEKEFMARATQLVEQHIGDSQYGVEQLAADLNMERTGLYKKLTALMQQSPVFFIRSIRLHRAANMLRRGDKSIAEISELTGFSSPSYFTKCFMKEFGCRPSEYPGK